MPYTKSRFFNDIRKFHEFRNNCRFWGAETWEDTYPDGRIRLFWHGTPDVMCHCH